MYFHEYPFLFISVNYVVWSAAKSTITAAIYWPIYRPWMVDGYDCAAINGMNEWQGKRKY
jgi:hypothetical protein